VAKQFISPTVWTPDELRVARVAAEEAFRVQRREEGPRTFGIMYKKSAAIVRQTMELTRDLTAVTAKTLAEHPKLWNSLRYFCAPPISEEDLWTFVGHKFKLMSTNDAQAAAGVFSDVLDRNRFPWLDTGRGPTPAQRGAAILATACLLSIEQLRTERRGSSSRVQEVAVARILESAGFQLTSAGQRGRQIHVLDELPRGWFSRERKVAGAKCDIPIRLHDGRLLAIECKVSNGPKNSWKRLSREVGGKAQGWRNVFGTQVITGAVLAGVFDLSCLNAAQEQQGVFLFWQHDLQPLADFIVAAT
jgi:hypothetical protein